MPWAYARRKFRIAVLVGYPDLIILASGRDLFQKLRELGLSIFSITLSRSVFYLACFDFLVEILQKTRSASATGE
jgi:hypothetical protein